MPKSKPLDIKNQIDLPLQVKRGRGRPRKADALSNAERQRRWRQKTVTLKAQVLEAAIGSHQPQTVDSVAMHMVERENEALRARVAQLESGMRGMNVYVQHGSATELRRHCRALLASLRNVTKKDSSL
ncbi:hypothetical protein P3W33_11780 [Luteibacter sp. PPL552]